VDPSTGLDDLEKRKFLTLPGLELDPSLVHLVTSRYTDYATPAPYSYIFTIFLLFSNLYRRHVMSVVEIASLNDIRTKEYL
jgi:hypothetical protein